MSEVSHAHENERTFLAAAFSMEFADCDVVASDLGKAAIERMSQVFDDKSKLAHPPARKKYIDELFIVNDAIDVAAMFCQDEVSNSFTINGIASQIVLIQPTVEMPKKEEITETKGRFIKKQVTLDIEGTEEVLSSDPVLAVRIGNDSALVLATFARRTNGNCSYVQLGSEITDDTIYATTADGADLERHALVTSLKALVARDSKILENPERYRPDLIQALIDQQIDAHRENLNKVYERQLVKAYFERMDNAYRRRSIITLNHENKPEAHEYFASRLSSPIKQVNGRHAELLLAASPTHQTIDRLDLFAVASGGLGVKLATMQKDGQIELDMATIDKDTRNQFVRQALTSLLDPSPGKDLFRFDGDYKDDSEIAQYGFEIGILRSKERGDYYKFQATPAQTASELDVFFMNPIKARMPGLVNGINYTFSSSKVLTEMRARHEDVQATHKSLMDTLQVSEKIAATWGSVRECDEELLQLIDAIAKYDLEVEAEFKNYELPNATTDIIVEPRLVKKDWASRLELWGVASSMADHRNKQPLINVLIDPTHTIPVQRIISKTAFELVDDPIAAMPEDAVRELASDLTKILLG